MSELPEIRTSRAILRLAIAADLASILDFVGRNAEEFAPTSPPRPADFLTAGYWAPRIEKNLEEFLADKSLRMFLFSAQRADEIIGTLSFTQFLRSPLHGCWMGYALDPSAQGKGIMTEAARAAIEHVFSRLNMHRIMAGYLPTNHRSGAVLRRLGFVVEGYARDYLLLNGRWEDQILAGLVNPAWRDPQ